ncbi:cupin [Streptomyces alkaliphilus]|uniref:Cupin n=1 Tax=Streptomyces alkaliphilus TaxID=1472722 RepID=A0A7W3Y2H1_9ACTN|nr:cupin [Streptomyces alkaliphilus]MBB0245307.1 cupin [Streptomyces alkaliphilus]MQS07246.1 cupin [Streptomyces alkaliphilus]
MEDLTALAEHHLGLAREDGHGRSAHLFLHDGPLRQSVIALTAGSELGEHDAPPAASLHVLRGRVRVFSEEGETEVGAGQVERLPRVRHGLRAVDDSAVVLTTVTGV